MMRQLFFKYQNKKQLTLALVGTFLGLFFLFTSLHFLHKIYTYGENSEMLSKNTIVIQKKVTSGPLLGLNNPEFSDEQIDEVRSMEFVESCDPIRSNTFDVVLSIDDPLIPAFNSNIYVQSVHEDYLDVKTDHWDWDVGSKTLPIIMPRDFLMMMNNFLSASNIPQLSDDLVLDLKIDLNIGPRNYRETIHARIVGFTNELSSILVPEYFLNWANQKYGEKEKEVISQLVVKSKDGQFGLLENYLEEKEFESKKSQLLIAKLKSTLGVLLTIISNISLLAVFLSMLVLIQYLQLIMTKNDYEIRTLLRLGHAPNQLIKVFLRYFMSLFSVVAVLSLLLFIPAKYYLQQIFISNGISLDSSLSIYLFLLVIFVFIVFALSIWLSTKKRIYKTVNT
ncbi:MAG: FtsX-like permease family protein [Crocinitomicaceae bacterium]